MDLLYRPGLGQHKRFSSLHMYNEYIYCFTSDSVFFKHTQEVPSQGQGH